MINSFVPPDVTNASQYPTDPGSESAVRNQFYTAFSTITNQLNTEVTNKLATTNGAENIGCVEVATNAGNTVQSNLDFTYGAIINVALGEIPNDSLTQTKMANEMKKDIIGGVASVNSTRVFEAIGTNSALDITTNSGYTYEQGRPIKFRTPYTSTGTTINVDGLGALPYLKSDGVTNATTTATKVYEAYYDSTNGGSFFGLARAEGTAVAADVLAGVTFSNDDDTNISGTLTLNGTANASDVLIGKTFYATNATSIINGTGKRQASGTAVSGSNYINATGFNSVNTNIGYSVYPIVVNTLNFTPSIITLIYTPTNDFINSTQTYYSEFQIGTTNTYDRIIMNRNTQSVYLRSSGDLYVSNTGFCMPTQIANVTFNWYAFE